MSVKEVLQALGNWGITLKPSTPRELIAEIEQNKFGHIAIVPGRIDPRQYNDGLLREARYVGVYRSTFKQSDDTIEIKGVGMNFWLGDEDDKGAIIETPVTFTNATFPNAIRALLPDSVQEGNLYSIPGAGTYNNVHQWETPRKAIQYIVDTYTTSAEFTGVDRIVEYRVNGDATVDAGPIENLYNMTPKAILVKKDTGRDMRMLGLQADMSMDYDVEDLTTRVVLLAEGEGETMATGSANATPTGFVDLFGNPIKMTRLVSESGTPSGNANTRAQLQLIRWSLPRQAIQIRTQEFDIKGDFVCGDYIYVFDPESGFYDLDNEVFWRGQPVNPLALRVKEMDWGVRAGWTVAFRKNDGTWLDLSEYYKPENVSSTLAVGDYRRTLAGNNYEPISFRPNLPQAGSDSTIPAAPTWDTFSTGSYQPENGDWTKAAVYASWFQPNNQDGSVITDGGHYEIRYRVGTFIGYDVKWGILAGHNRVFEDAFERAQTDTWGTQYTNVGGIAADFFVDGTKGVHTPSALNSSRSSIINGVNLVDLRIEGTVTPPVLATGGSYRGGWSFRRDGAGSNFLRVEGRFDTDGTYQIVLARVGGAGAADLVTVPLGSYTPGTEYWIRAEAVGTSIRGKMWAGAYEDAPSAWQIDTTETSVTASGEIAPRSLLASGNTNAMPVPIKYDNIAVTDLSYTGGYKWGELSGNKWGAPITAPVQASQEWNTVFVGWGQTQTLIQELTPGIQYEFQIRAVDSANPAHVGPWSASEFVLASDDLFAPDVPAAPVVASSRISIQVVHMLGKASGGTYNLPPDLTHLSVHVGGSDSFLADDSNMVGKLIANSGMIQAQIPAIGTFQIEQTDNVWVKVIAVDRAGNKSGASNAVQASVELIDDAHISDLTVSKITAGSIMATWIMAGAIKTANAGARVELDATGINVFNSAGFKSFEAKSSDGSVSMTGRFQTLDDGNGITIEPGSQPKIRITPNDTYDHNGRLLSFNDVGGLGTVMDLSVRRSSDDAIDGGKILLWENGTVLSHQPNVGSERYIGVNYPVAGTIQLHNPGSSELLLDNDTGDIEFWGKFPNYISADPKQAYFTVGDSTAGTGPILPTYSYGATMARTLWPVISAQASADTFVRVSAKSTTSFTVGLSAAVPHGLHAWCLAM